MSSDQESSNRGPGGLFDRLSLTERKWTLAALRNETVGGVLMLTAAAVALILANSQFGDWYAELSETTFGPAALKSISAFQSGRPTAY